MTDFAQFLAEETALFKNTHLQHPEDLAFSPQGSITKSLTILQGITDFLYNHQHTSDITISTKWDGSPSLVFGWDPVDDQFFVSTKQALRQKHEPVLFKTHDDIAERVSNDGLAHVLHTALRELSSIKVPPRAIWQADVLFTKDQIHRHANGMASFCTNVLTYGAMELASEAQIGLVLHTKYLNDNDEPGTDLRVFHAAPTTIVDFQNRVNRPEVFMVNGTYPIVPEQVSLTASEYAQIMTMLAKCEHRLRMCSSELLTTLQQSMFAEFVNGYVRNGVWWKTGHEAAQLCVIHVGNVGQKHVESLRTKRGRLNSHERTATLIASLINEQSGLAAFFDAYACLRDAKILLVDALSRSPQPLATFLPHPDGSLHSIAPEGFVVRFQTGSMYKLVDRMTFSHLNFTTPRSWLTASA